MGNRKMKKFFATMMIAAMLCPSMVYADTLDAAPLEEDLVLVTEDEKQFQDEQPSEDITIEGDFNLEPDYQEESDLDLASFDSDEEVLYSADEGLSADYEDPDPTPIPIAGLGTGPIDNPSTTATNSPWAYVYYGKYTLSGTTYSLKYRVLTKDTTDYSSNGENREHTVLLDCDYVLDRISYYDGSASSCLWDSSTIKNWLNTDFYNASFSEAEKDAIIDSYYTYYNGQGESQDHSNVFLLKSNDIGKTEYRYSEDDKTFRRKTPILGAEYKNWWLRDPSGTEALTKAYAIKTDGSIETRNQKLGTGDDYGASPVINVNRASVIFTQNIPNSSGTYKFTLKDSKMNVSVPTGTNITRSGNTITVPFSVTGENKSNANRVSVLLIKGNEGYKPGEAVTTDYCLVKVVDLPSSTRTGIGTFILPSGYTADNCKAYLVAEAVNEGKLTDYASTPTLITIPPVYSITVNSSANGTVTVDGGKIKAAAGESITVTAAPNDETTHEFDKWEITGVDLTDEQKITSPLTFTMGTSNVTVKAVFKEKTVPPTKHRIDVQNNANGTVKVEGDKVEAATGESVKLTATPTDTATYEFKEWDIEGVTLSNADKKKNPLTFTMGTSNVTVNATFVKKTTPVTTTYTITALNDGNGTATASPVKAATGQNVTLTATPKNSDYRFNAWIINKGGVKFDTSKNPVTFKMGSSDVEVKATFEKISKPGPTPASTHTITMLATSKKGKASASVKSAAKGKTVNIAATSKKGYTFKEWRVISGGVKLKNAKSAKTSFTMGDKNVKIKAYFYKASFKLNSSKLVVEKGKTNSDVKATLKHDELKSAVSSNKNVATAKIVGKKLQIKGKKAGKAKITVKTKSGLKRKLNVTVQADKVTTTKLRLSTSKVSVGKNKKKYVKATATPNYFSTGEKIKVKSSDRKIATCTINRTTNKIRITGKKKGKCEITVTAGKKTKTITVTVK